MLPFHVTFSPATIRTCVGVGLKPQVIVAFAANAGTACNDTHSAAVRASANERKADHPRADWNANKNDVRCMTISRRFEGAKCRTVTRAKQWVERRTARGLARRV